MPSGHEEEREYGGRPPFDPNRIWPVLLSVLLARYAVGAVYHFLTRKPLAH